MKKGLFVVLLGVFCAFGLFGCSKDASSLAKKNVSEKVLTYFSGAKGFKANISSGKRENPYSYNGVSSKLFDFAVLTVACDSSQASIDVEVIINSVSENKRLEIDNLTGQYLTDLEKFIKEDDVVCVKYKGEELLLECRSKGFQIDSDKALEIGIENFKTEIEKLVSKNELLAEVYLRVLDSFDDDLKHAYWYFYIYAQNGSTYACVIDVNSGNILVKN